MAVGFSGGRMTARGRHCWGVCISIYPAVVSIASAKTESRLLYFIGGEIASAGQIFVDRSSLHNHLYLHIIAYFETDSYLIGQVS